MKKENTTEYKVEQIFAQHEGLEEIFMCADDQAFRNEDAATAHAKNCKSTKVTNYKRPEVKAVKADSVLDLSVAKLTEALEQITAIEELDKLIADENAKEAPRKTAVEALEERKAVLVAALEINE